LGLQAGDCGRGDAYKADSPRQSQRRFWSKWPRLALPICCRGHRVETAGVREGQGGSRRRDDGETPGDH
jgi:hypothetical protein